MNRILSEDSIDNEYLSKIKHMPSKGSDYYTSIFTNPNLAMELEKGETISEENVDSKIEVRMTEKEEDSVLSKVASKERKSNIIDYMRRMSHLVYEGGIQSVKKMPNEDRIASGSYGSISMNPNNHGEVVKFINKSYHLSSLLNEIVFSFKVRNSNIFTRINGILENSSGIGVTMKKEDCDLYMLIEENPDLISNALFWADFIDSFLNILIELEKERIIHCDIKEENILISHSAFNSTKRLQFHYRLIDFGMAYFCNHSCLVNSSGYTCLGTMGYASPEMMKYDPVRKVTNSLFRPSYKSDLWSFGATIVSILNFGVNQSEFKIIMDKIVEDISHDKDPAYLRSVPINMRYFLYAILDPYVESRLSAVQARDLWNYLDNFSASELSRFKFANLRGSTIYNRFKAYST